MLLGDVCREETRQGEEHKQLAGLELCVQPRLDLGAWHHNAFGHGKPTHLWGAGGLANCINFLRGRLHLGLQAVDLIGL